MKLSGISLQSPPDLIWLTRDSADMKPGARGARSLLLSMLSSNLLDGSLELRSIGSYDGGSLLPILVDDKGRHGADLQVLGQVRQLVDVDLVEACIGVHVGEACSISEWTIPERLRDRPDYCWGNDLARPTPSGKAIDHHDATLLHGLVELLLAGDESVGG